MLHQNSSKGNEEFALLRRSFSRVVSTLSIIFSSKLLLSLVTNKTLTDSVAYSRCQQLLLSLEIRCKKRGLRQLIFKYDHITQELQYHLSPNDFMHVTSFC